MRNYPLYEHPNIMTFAGLLSANAAKSPDNTAFQYTEKKRPVTVTHRQFQRNVVALSAFLQGLGNRTVAILGENSYFWILTFFAAVHASKIAVPLDKELNAGELGSLLRRFDAPVLVCSDAYMDVAEKLLDGGFVERVISMADYPQILSVNGGSNSSPAVAADEDAVCSVFFTSGTTGQPKGVMLTQKNMMLDAINACRNLKVSGGSVLTLPLHHTFGFTVGVLAELMYGYPIYISRGLRHFRNELKEYRPQNLILVPLYVETMYKNIWKAAREKGKEKTLKRLLAFSRFLRRCGIDIRRRLFHPVLASLGGELEEIVCGGAFLDQRYIDGLADFGIQVLNGYGITECSPVVAVNRNKYSQKNSVGLPLPNVEVRIDDGEVCVKGETVMAGYYHDDAATRDAFCDGWYRTGDLGCLDRNGFLFITGRKKNLIILSNGENVSLEELEEKLSRIPGFEKNGAICAEIYPEDAAGIRERVSELNKTLPAHKRINDIRFRAEPFEKTTTKKIKRHA